MERKEIVLYGIDNYLQIIDQVISDLCITRDYFDIKLILTEALTNAYKHGNSSDKTKPIKLAYYSSGKTAGFEIQDSGINNKPICIPDKIEDDAILNESGKGLFLIKALSDKFEIRNNALIIEKNIADIW